MDKTCFHCGAHTFGGKFCPECGKKIISTTSNDDQNSSLPVAIPIGGQNLQSSELTSASAPSFPISYQPKSPIDVPKAATGPEVEALYNQCIHHVTRTSGNSATSVSEFKANCKAYGQSTLDVKAFYNSLVAAMGDQATDQLIPLLVRLIPVESKRRDLIVENQKRKEGKIQNKYDTYYKHQSNPPDIVRNTERVSTERVSTSSRDTMTSNSSCGTMSNPRAEKGFTSGRYKDHPTCDICSIAFEITKRRHQCRMCGKYTCSGCSPVKMLIPPGQQIENARGYDPSLPQRVCITCAPLLSEHQNDLCQTYGNFTKENPHEAKARLHMPYSGNLEKECRNAADIIGNFFRQEWGASSDQHIPIAFLEKASGLAFMTIIKVGFLVTGKVGTGLVIAKLPDGSWSAPSAIGTLGVGGGLEIGGEIVELMLILGSPNAIKVFYKPQVNIGAGLDLAIGPYGRSAQAAAAASGGGLNVNYSYSHSRGLYAGVSLQGAVIATRKDINQKFYGRDISPEEILSGQLGSIRAARPLYDAIENSIQSCQAFKDEQNQISIARGPCKVCGCTKFVVHNTQKWNKKCKACSHLH